MNILVVDDEAVQRDLLSGFLKNQGYQVATAANGEQALELFAAEPINLVIIDHRMPGLTGDRVLAQMKAMNPLVRAIMITAYGNVDTAVSVMKLGADEYLEKPVDLPALLQKIEILEQRLAVDQDVETVSKSLEHGPLPLRLVAESPAMKEIISLAQRVSQSPFAVLIHGETGTGKELVARLIHLLSSRKDSQFIEVNCAAIPENLFESELFGHEKGAFTGAVSMRRGRFELADSGTLFLDEIGDLPMFVQPKLLRAIQENVITRVGGEKSVHMDVRLISATNRNLKDLAEKDQFREDLLFRIKVLEIVLPPLRQRRDDIPALVDFFLERYGSPGISFTPEALDALIKYPFPGNVRELENVVQRTITLTRSTPIRPQDLPEEIRHHRATAQGTLTERLEAVEREMLLSALTACGWIQTQAAQFLGISERVLRYKMKKHAIKGTPPK